MCALKRVVLICNAVYNRVNFGFQRFQCHVHTYRILPDADGLLAVQVSVHHHTDNTELRRKTRGKRNTIDVWNLYTENHSWSDGVRGIKQWFVTAWGKENRNMYAFPLCTGSVTAAVALFEWHLCHVAACLRRKLSSTEDKLFLCLRDSYSTYTLGHSPLGMLICYVYVWGCLY